MAIIFFENITKEHSYLGGKGYALGLMKNADFPVPEGLVLTEVPSNDLEWAQIFTWWKQIGGPKLAIRSSAIGEDSSEQSFAGQNSTYLNIDNENDIKNSVISCFQSMYKKSSALYREHFLKEKAEMSSMNVVIQKMVNPKISGVFFSVDPRTNENGWIVEAIEGLGEDLVSGRKTPWHFEKKSNCETKLFDLNSLVDIGLKVRDFFSKEIDMEWAIDQNNQINVLQARPITALSGKSEEKRMIEEEIHRLKSTHEKNTIWDGATFAEWSSPPTELTFSIWKEAFAKNRAFSKALRKLGYLGINEDIKNQTHSLLEKIFDRAYVNVSLMAPLYFGPIPYRLDFNHGPKLKFDFNKMNFKTLALTPITMARMIKVSFRLSTERSNWLNQCQKELIEFQLNLLKNRDIHSYENLTDKELYQEFRNEVEAFYDHHLVWPLVLITLIESTSQSLKTILNGVLPDTEIEKTINHWFSFGLHTVTMEMNEEYQKASNDEKLQKDFLEKYGHRGPGELELCNPRWSELKTKAFIKSQFTLTKKVENDLVSKEIHELKTFKKQVIEKEWLLLKDMLELREKWKMALLSPYSRIRFIALEIAKRKNIGNDIFWFNYSEILAHNFPIELALKRKNHATLSKSISLPSFIELSELENILMNKTPANANKIIQGEALSPGIVYGEIRVVNNPENVNTDEWPENTILIAESTDPGWTGLFLKAKAVVVEKGGVLSHCAIVAREMGLPAISGIRQCHLRFKNGDKIWVDGNNGRITLS